VALDGQSVWTFLIDKELHDVRQGCCCHRAGKDMVAKPPLRCTGPAGQNPSDSGQCKQHVLISSPRHSLRDVFGGKIGVLRHLARNALIKAGGTNSKYGHFSIHIAL
jgi:hypothetical protein